MFSMAPIASSGGGYRGIKAISKLALSHRAGRVKYSSGEESDGYGRLNQVAIAARDRASKVTLGPPRYDTAVTQDVGRLPKSG